MPLDPPGGRLRLIEIGADERALLGRLREAIGDAPAGFVDAFYQRLLEHPATRALIDGPEQLQRLRCSQHAYLREMLSGPFDEAYARQRRRIGLVHQRVGLEPQLYVEASAFLLSSLLDEAGRHFAGDPATVAAVSSALVKVMLLDVGLAIDNYVAVDRAALRESMDRLRESQALLSEAQDLAQLGRWELTLPDNRLRACPRATELLGLPDGGVALGGYRLLRAQVSAEDREALRAVTRRALRRGDTYDIRYAVRMPDGGLRHVRERARGVVDAMARVRRLVGTVQDVSVQVGQVERIRRLALYDHLTGLPNRAQFYQVLEETLLGASIDGSSFCVLFIDLDQFKEINDTEGHDVGDQVLVDVAGRLTTLLAGERLVARLGGDEFVVITRAGDSAAGAALARRVHEALSRPVRVGEGGFRVGASIGLSVFPADGQTVHELVRNADTAMYEAKRHASRVEVFAPEMGVRVRRQVAMAKRLEAAIEDGAIGVHFQPQVSLHDGRLVGVEALARWRDPELGQVSPVEFVALAEAKGLILSLGEVVMRQGMGALAAWGRAGLAPEVRLAVNVSSRQLDEPRFVHWLREAIERWGLEPTQIDLELTESGMMLDIERAARALGRLRSEGFGISVDDFGSGYSSLSQLRGLPITQVKLDRSFIGNMLGDTGDHAIVAAAVAMADSLGLGLVAEGVETAAQADALRALGCRYAQGYLFDPPLSAEDFAGRWVCT